MLLPTGWETSVVAFVHTNEFKCGSQSFACLVTLDSEQGHWDKKITTVDGKVVIDGQNLGFRGKASQVIGP